MRILITGAAGSGTSTVGERLACSLQASFHEADHLYWLPTDPPFQEKRPPGERLQLMLALFAQYPRIVVSGSVMNWGEQIEDAFDLIVFLQAPTTLRIERIKQRDLKLFGSVRPEFIQWAAQYDEGSMTGRSLARHNSWLSERRCAVLRLESVSPPSELVEHIRDKLNALPPRQH
jgi:adenylate kinase family enzyme